MKLFSIGAVVAGVGIVQIVATPIRIITIISGQGGANIDGARFGHSVPLAPAIATVKLDAGQVEGAHVHRPCGGSRMSRFRQKGIEISNTFRKVLGLELIEANPHLTFKKADHGVVHIMPFMGTPHRSSNYHSAHKQHHGAQLNYHHHIHAHGRSRSFATRLHFSLMNLGRWEGRAVAFVLGCGIGVLLRMFWVLAIVTYRAIRGQREEEHEYSHIIIEEFDADALVHVPPPNYTYPVDEKVAVVEDAPKAPATTE